MTVKPSLEFSILGCSVRLKAGEKTNIDAKLSVELVEKEIETLREKNPDLKDVELAVLSALKFASESLETEAEFKQSIFALKTKVERAIGIADKNIQTT